MTSIVNRVEELYKVLSNEADTYRQLVAATQRERLSLQEENLIELSMAAREKEVLMKGLVTWEKTRQHIVATLSEELKLPIGASLLDIILQLDDALAQKLSSLRQEFIKLVEQLLTLNHGNRLLLQTGLARIDATFEYLASLATPTDGNYSA
ncbi:MAG: flagellar export chaperone FlgN, partial [Chloroflexota bacterium]